MQNVMTEQDLVREDDVALADRMKAGRESILREMRKLIIGQEDVLEQVLLSLFVGGNSLIVGVPGLAKTLLIATMARVLDLKFNRIQFTPDLMPSDITGTEIINEEPGTGRRSLVFAPGPVFANIVLADEINRTPPKTQAALLQAMQEKEVTAGGQTHRLDLPFFVLATQNPIELEGTYPLPEAQLDRFMFNVSVGYPSQAEEERIVLERAALGSGPPRQSGIQLRHVLHQADQHQRQRCRFGDRSRTYGRRMADRRDGDLAVLGLDIAEIDHAVLKRGQIVVEIVVVDGVPSFTMKTSGSVTPNDEKSIAHRFPDGSPVTSTNELGPPMSIFS